MLRRVTKVALRRDCSASTSPNGEANPRGKGQQSGSSFFFAEGRVATISGTDDSTEGVPGPSQLGTGEVLPSRRRKPATRAKYGSPSRKTGDTGAAARREPASAGVRTADRYTARRAPRRPECDVLSPAEAGYGRWGPQSPQSDDWG